MPQADSVDKIVRSYFATVTAEPFTYKGTGYAVPELAVSPLLLRGYTCPLGCGGCCGKFTLDYLPSEAQPATTKRRIIKFNGLDVPIFTDDQTDNTTDRCQNLNPKDGRCGIYEVRPFSCDFELIRMMPTGERAARVTQQLFSRGWNMRRVDGNRGARCTMTPADPASVRDVLRKLKRLQEWADHFSLRTRVPAIMEWAAVCSTDIDNAFPLRFTSKDGASL